MFLSSSSFTARRRPTLVLRTGALEGAARHLNYCQCLFPSSGHDVNVLGVPDSERELGSTSLVQRDLGKREFVFKPNEQ